MRETGIGGASGDFPETRWTLIVSSRATPESRRAALEELLGLYWKPLYFFARRKGLDVESAKDAVQGFFAHLLEADDFLARLDRSKGRFRSYLRTALDNFMANLREARQAAKRGGGKKTVALDWEVAESELAATSTDADAAFDREWALGVMERALAELRREFESGKRKGPFELALRFFDPKATPPTYDEACKSSGMTPVQWKAFLHRARERFRALVKEQVSQTTSSAKDQDDELGHLLKALGS
jgi:DNA-directed RNA polymerase specialized sigma24 family protein